MKRIFDIEVTCGEHWLGDAVLELDQAVFDNVDGSFREMYYDLNTPEEIVEHIAYNMIVNDARLSQLDGWANLDDSMAHMLEWPHGQAEYEFDVTERKE